MDGTTNDTAAARSETFGRREVDELKKRLATDPMFAYLYKTVYSSISSGDVSIEDWRQAVNLAFTRWHSENVQPLYFIPAPDADATPCGHKTWHSGCSYCEDRRLAVLAALSAGPGRDHG